MIFDRQVTFYDTTERHYDPKKHGYVGGGSKPVTLPANVTDMGVNKSAQLFGDYQRRALVIRTIYEPPRHWGYLALDGDSRKYVLNTYRKPLKYFTLIVGERSNEQAVRKT